MNRWIADCGVRIADCGVRIADCVLRHGSWPVSRSERNTELSMNLAIRTGRSPGPSDLRFTMYDLRGSDGVLAALRDSHARRSERRGARKSYIVNRQWLGRCPGRGSAARSRHACIARRGGSLWTRPFIAGSPHEFAFDKDDPVLPPRVSLALRRRLGRRRAG